MRSSSALVKGATAGAGSPQDEVDAGRAEPDRDRAHGRCARGSEDGAEGEQGEVEVGGVVGVGGDPERDLHLQLVGGGAGQPGTGRAVAALLAAAAREGAEDPDGEEARADERSSVGEGDVAGRAGRLSVSGATGTGGSSAAGAAACCPGASAVAVARAWGRDSGAVVHASAIDLVGRRCRLLDRR